MSRVLIIDDDDNLREAMGALLEDAGHEVWSAPDGARGVALQRVARAEVVITDIFMPDAEGLETISQLVREFPGVAIVAISGGGRLGSKVDYLDLALKVGALRVMRKPVDPATLLSVISGALSERATHSTT